MGDKQLRFIPGKGGRPGYYITDITINYRRIRRFAGYTKAEAKDYLANLRLAARDGRLEDLIRPKAKEPPRADIFGDYARSLLDSAEWKAKRSASRNEISLKNLNRSFEDIPLQDVSPGRVREYMTMRAKEVAPATINREISFLKSVLFCAEADKLIQSNPIRGRAVKALAENNNREKSILSFRFTDDDLRHLIDCMEPEFKPIVELALSTGLRLGEILKMRWKDVDLDSAMIRIPAENAKSKKERFIPMGEHLLILFDSLEKRHEYIFRDGSLGTCRLRVEEAFRRACEKAGIHYGRKDDGLVFHDLRHIAAYRLVKVTDVVTASKILGHSSLQMTMRYVHPTDNDKREAIERAAEGLFQGRQKVDSGTSSRVLKELKNGSQVN